MVAALVSVLAVVAPPTVAVSDTVAGEGASAVFVVRLSATARRVVTVRFATADGSATAGADYLRRRGTLLFGRGERTKRVSVPVMDDAEPEGEETFFLIVSKPRGAKVARPRASARIRASDLPAPFTLHADLSAADEVPSVANPTGRGTAVIVFDAAREEVSFTVSVQGMTPGPSGLARGARREFPATVLVFDTQFPATGTLTGTKRLELPTILDVRATPSSYAVRVASAEGFDFIRGHLALP
jgi:hypothetical protein